MIGRLAALILLSTLSQSIGMLHQISVTVADLGTDLTLTCPEPVEAAGLFYWYKLKFGYMVQTVAAGSFNTVKLDGQFYNSRFNFKTVAAKYFLTITNVSKEDEAMYYCQSGSAYKMEVINGTLLAVNDPKNQQKHVNVEQSPQSASVQPGGSVTLQCSLLSSVQCLREHSVYWFRAGSGGSHPAVIYTHRNRSDGRSCVYSLSRTIRDSSDAGTYHCAVVTCGHILFGEGTKVDTRQSLFPSVIVLGTLLACCVIVIVALIISRNQQLVCKHCKGKVTAFNHAEHHRSAEDQPSNVDDEAAALNYVALNFPLRKSQRWTNNRELPDECMYSTVKRCS